MSTDRSGTVILEGIAMTTQKQQSSKQGKAPIIEAAPPRRDEQQRSNKVDPRGSNHAPQNGPTGKRSDQEALDASATEKRDQQKTHQQSDIPNRQ